jgi:hypothetical protein
MQPHISPLTRAPVPMMSFWYVMVSPEAVVNVLLATSADTTLVLVKYSMPAWALSW